MRAYDTVRSGAESELTVQKSRFIGNCFPAESEEAALAHLNGLRKRYWDASHNCYAYRIGPGAGVARYGDDGEPGGTAGLPILEALRQRDVTDAVCVVTRYFGGVLLGTGGLARAYGRAAADAVAKAGVVKMRPCVGYRIEADYALFYTLEPLLRSFGEPQIAYGARVEAGLLVPEERAAAFLKAVAERTDGRVSPAETERRYGVFPEDGPGM